MLVENINYIDLVIEGIKALLVLVLNIILWRCGRKYPELVGGSWNLIIIGFIGIEVGMLLDWSDEIIDYSKVDLIESIVEEGIVMLGFISVIIGFNKWFEFVSSFLGIERS